MLMTKSVQVTILGLLILITFANVGLIAYPFGSQVEATTAQNNTKALAIGGNKNVTVTENRANISAIQSFFAHRANISATGPLFVLYPEANRGYAWGGYSENPSGQLVIEVLFNKPVDTATVIPQSNLILNMERNANAPVTLNWDFNNRFLTITTSDRTSDLCTYDPDCFFSLTLDGIAPGEIKAADGTILNAGVMDYWTGFVIVG